MLPHCLSLEKELHFTSIECFHVCWSLNLFSVSHYQNYQYFKSLAYRIEENAQLHLVVRSHHQQSAISISLFVSKVFCAGVLSFS